MSCLVVFTSAYSSDFDSSQIYYQKGIDELTARRYMVASAYLEKAVQLNPNYEDAYLKDAYVNLEMHRMDNAKALFLKVYEIDPNNVDAIKQLTTIFYNYHQYDKAMEFAKKINSCDNDRIIALCNYELEDYGNAETGLKKVLTKDPNDALVNYTLARCYLDMAEELKAIPYYQKAIAIDPANNSWMYELGLIYYNNGDFVHTIEMLNKAADNGYIKSNDFNENLGYAYIYNGNFDKGEPLLLNILSRKPGEKDILRDLADAFYKYKQYDKSLEYCQKLMEIDMKDAKALYQAGLCFQKKGQKDKGEKMCDAAIELDPSLASLKQKVDQGMGM